MVCGRSKAGLAALVIAGCASENRECKTDHTEPQVYVMSEIRFAREVEGVSDGFDLDGVDGGGCGIADFTSPEGAPGIDNAFARIVPALELTEAAAVEPLIQDAINNGALLLLVELAGMDDAGEDECVDVGVLRGAGEPLVGTDRRLLSHQTLDVDASVDPVWVERATIAAGSAHAAPVTVFLPIQILDADLAFEMSDGALRIDLHEDGTASGVFGGGLEVAALMAEMAETGNVDPNLIGAMEVLLEQNADLDPGPDGVCRKVSTTFEFTAVPVYVFDGE